MAAALSRATSRLRRNDLHGARAETAAPDCPREPGHPRGRRPRLGRRHRADRRGDRLGRSKRRSLPDSPRPGGRHAARSDGGLRLCHLLYRHRPSLHRDSRPRAGGRDHQLPRSLLPARHRRDPGRADTSALAPGAGVPLSNEDGQGFTGSSAAFDATNSPASLRFDPEGIRMSPAGTFFVSDEYGPFVYEFNAAGRRLRSLPVPANFLIDHPRAVGADELPPTNTKGRQSNRGMDGLAISPDGSKLYGMMQNALIQDGALNAANQRRGFHNRILEIDLATGATREFVYVLTDRSNGVNEILAINDHQFLVIERDGAGGNDAAFKKLFKIDITGATDVSGVPSLPQTAPLPPAVVPVSKTLFLDLLDPAFGLKGPNFPEKIEGLAFGPDLPGGRHLLLVSHDNDFTAQDTKL